MRRPCVSDGSISMSLAVKHGALSCPYCGHHDAVRLIDHDFDFYAMCAGFSVRCSRCGLQGPVAHGGEIQDAQGAVTAWNSLPARPVTGYAISQWRWLMEASERDRRMSRYFYYEWLQSDQDQDREASIHLARRSAFRYRRACRYRDRGQDVKS